MKRIKKYDCISVGDWVRFMRNCQFVIGEVSYIVDDSPIRVEFYTTAGIVTADSILEHRTAINKDQS